MGKEKDIALGKPVHNSDILIVDQLVYRFINGDKKERYLAQEEILKYFNEYLCKYINLFTGAQVDLRNYETRIFLSMFLTGRPKTIANLSQQKTYIAKVMSKFDKNDIKNEIILVFLGVLHKYRIYEGVNALNPLTKFFRFRLKDWFNRTVRDAMFRTVDVESFGTNSDDGKKMDVGDWLDLFNANRYHHIEGGSFGNFDLSWMLNPYGSLYKKLTPYDRYLLHLVFGEDLKVPQIAEKLQRDRDTIRRHLARLFKTLEESYGESKGGA